MPREDVLNEVRAWLQKSESDFQTIDLLLAAQDTPLDAVCFHAQQGTEKYLKGFLTFLGRPFARTHDLEVLLALIPAGSAVHAVAGDLNELSDAAIVSRYPDVAADYSRADTERLVEQARAVKDAVLSELTRLGFNTQR